MNLRSRRLQIVLALAVVAAIVFAGWWARRQRAFRQEVEEIVALLELRPGMVVADVGAGDGRWSVELAPRLGPGGTLWATEIDEGSVEEIRSEAEAAGLDNVRVVRGTATDTGLPPACCDAILLRTVYHHFTDPAAMNRSMLEALRPGGVLAVIDFEPATTLLPQVSGTPDNRGGHGMPVDLLIEETTAAGFELVERRPDWGDEMYAVLLRRPPPSSAPDDPARDPPSRP